MKFQLVSLFAALAVSVVNAELPDNFYEQCCVIPAVLRERRQRKLDENKLKKLGGYDYLTGAIDPLCGTPPGPKDDGIVCYSYEEICENTVGYFAPSTPAATNKVCENGANCYNPNVDGPECIGDANGFPDIWWSCVTASVLTDEDIDTFHCGFECKFTEACGDPHFQTFDGKWFDFHGECDLVLLSAEEFGMGLGLDIHIRTKGRFDYSFIESAAIKIGDDILEVSSYGAYSFNGVSDADLSTAKFADMYSIEHVVKDAQNSEYFIHTGGSEFIKVKSFKDLVSVQTGNTTAYNFGSSVGMMGDFFQGQMLARDGKTVVDNADDFGLEWQVTESDPSLFQTPSPATGKCIMPSDRASKGRRLGASVSKADAMTACSHVQGDKFNLCVVDVVSTGDIDTAKSY